MGVQIHSDIFKREEHGFLILLRLMAGAKNERKGEGQTEFLQRFHAYDFHTLGGAVLTL